MGELRRLIAEQVVTLPDVWLLRPSVVDCIACTARGPHVLAGYCTLHGNLPVHPCLKKRATLL